VSENGIGTYRMNEEGEDGNRRCEEMSESRLIGRYRALSMEGPLRRMSDRVRKLLRVVWCGAKTLWSAILVQELGHAWENVR
jgi:hypothetical protein